MAAEKKEGMKAQGIDPSIAAKHASSAGAGAGNGAIDPANRISIDGKEYDFTKLPEDARRLIVQMRVADQEISRLQATLAIIHDARQGYGAKLSTLLPK